MWSHEHVTYARQHCVCSFMMYTLTVLALQIDDLRACMESLGFWGQGPTGVAADELSNEDMMKLGGALQGVVELCCKVAQMEGVEMNTLLKRTYET